MINSVTRTCTLPSGREIPVALDDDEREIDRWENDGGRSLSTKYNRGRE